MEKAEGRIQAGGQVVFLSYAHADREQAERLWRALELWGVPVWKDDRELRAGEKLDPVVQAAIEEAWAFLLLGTLASLESDYVDLEIGWALEVEKRSGGTFQMIPVRAGAGKKTLERAFGREGERLYADATHGVEDAVPSILRALEKLPTVGGHPGPRPEPPPRDELILRFRKPRWATEGGKRRAAADLEIVHRPHGAAEGRTDGLAFKSPLGPVELERLRWYLELYPLWTFGRELVNAREVEVRLPEWGRALYDETLGHAEEAVERLLLAKRERRVVVEVLGGGDDGAASALLGLPWELLARGGEGDDGYLFSGARAVRVVRRLPRERAMEPPPLARILRVLLVVSRPDDAGYIDARESLTPLAEALSALGDKVDLHVLSDATFPALREVLKAAREARRPYQVVHFDGHGVYDPDQGLGMLVFEHPEDAGKVQRRKDLVGAKDLGEVLAEERVPLFVLEACQTAQADEKAESSVAAGLLRAGVGSVVAMSHAVLVETARRFVEAFYPALASGRRIGAAMVEAQQALFTDRRRNRRGQAEWELHDWFVPVLFQDETGDVVLLPPGPLPEPDFVQRTEEHRLGQTPPKPPAHGFVGRSREILILLRLLQSHRAVAVLGTGGQGKTALAAEAARWMLQVRRFERLAWVSAEHHSEARTVLDVLGRQLVAGWTGVAAYEGPGGDLRPAIQKVQGPLSAWRVLVVVDNLETSLEDPDPDLLPMLAELGGTGESRLLGTSREPLTELSAAALRLDRLGATDGKALVEGVLKARGLEPPAEGNAAAWVGRLVEVVRGHPRALVLLAPEVARRGLAATHDELVPLMEELDKAAGTDAEKREISLLASVRLSLRRLTPEERSLAQGLVVFRQAAEVRVLAYVLQVQPEEAARLCSRLVDLGLGAAHNSGPLAFLLPDPALALAFGEGNGLRTEELSALEERWFESIGLLVSHLGHQKNHADARISADAIGLALGELLVWIETAEARVEAGALAVGEATQRVGRIESLLQGLSRRRILDRVVAARRRLAALVVGVGSHAGFEARRYEVQSVLQDGDLRCATELAGSLYEDAEAMDDDAYPGAVYDRAMAPNLIAQVLEAAGAASQALTLFETARARFLALADDDEEAARMATVCLGRTGDCLLHLGQLHEAAEIYEQVVADHEDAGRSRGVALTKQNLGTVRMLQGRSKEAVKLHREARELFEQLGEADGAAASWHQEAMAWGRVGQYREAERCHLASLEVQSRTGNPIGEASSLNELGLLYDAQGRLEEALAHFGRAAASFRAGGHALNEARSLTNRADTLRKLDRLDEAWADVSRALELKAPFGLAADPWTTHAVRFEIETAAGDSQAAAEARGEAIGLYAAYRDGGGAPQQWSGRLIEQLRRFIAAGAAPGALADQLPPSDALPESLHRFRAVLEALLRGQSVDLDDPRHHYTDVVELRRLQAALRERIGG